MLDFRAISYQGVTAPTSYRLNAGASFLDIRGTSFVDVANVLINGYRSPNFIVESTTRIFAEIPSAARGEPVTDIQVLLLSAAPGQESAVVLDVGGGDGYVSGTAKLLQTFIKVLLTTPGSDYPRDLITPGAACGGDQSRSPSPGHDDGSPCTCRRSA